MKIKNKKRVFLELKEQFANQDAKVTLADSILIEKGDFLIKVPVKQCAEEVYLLRTFEQLGIPTVKIRKTGILTTPSGQWPYYTMDIIKNITEVVDYGDKFLNSWYYTFLEDILEKCKRVSISGFGKIRLTNGEAKGEHASEKKFFQSLLETIFARAYWPEKEITKLRKKIEGMTDSSKAVLVHNDLLTNILTTKNGEKFYLIDPQTSVSAANEYWDLSSYLIYANGYSCVRGLEVFMGKQEIKDWGKFILTAKLVALERISFYDQYDPARTPNMNAFWRALTKGHVLAGRTTLSQSDWR